jgi:mercuric reductase
MGAGYIGLEIAMAYNRLGVKVRIIEFTDRVLRTQTPDISEALETQMRKEGIEILPNFRAVKFEKQGMKQSFIVNVLTVHLRKL